MHAYKIMHGLRGTGQMMFTKYIAVVNDEVNVHNTSEVLFRLCANTDSRDRSVGSLILNQAPWPKSLSRLFSSQPPNRVPLAAIIGAAIVVPDCSRIPIPHGLETSISARRSLS